MRGCRIELGRIPTSQTAHVPGEFDHHRLHTQADAEVRNLLFAREANGIEHTCDSTLTETTGYQNSIKFAQRLAASRPFHLFRFDPFDVHPGLMRNSRM